MLDLTSVSGLCRSALGVLLAFALGCGDDPSAPAPSLELGTGEWEFEPLAAGERVQLVAGTQGGFHVWLSMRARGLTGTRLRMQLDLISDSSAPPASSDVEISFDPMSSPDAKDTWLEHVGWPAQLLSPWCAVERNLSIRVKVSEGDGESASAEIEIIPTAPPHGFPQSCEMS